MTLDSQFHIKDLGEVNYFLRLQFNNVAEGLVVHQHKFAQELFALYSMEDVVTVSSPLPHTLKFLPLIDNPLNDPTMYKQLIGKLNFLVHTRLDITFTIQHLSQFNKTLCQQHYDSTLHVLKYIKGTINQGLFFNKSSNFNIEAYCDSDWRAYPITRRSISGNFIVCGGSPISWKSKIRLQSLFFQPR